MTGDRPARTTANFPGRRGAQRKAALNGILWVHDVNLVLLATSKIRKRITTNKSKMFKEIWQLRAMTRAMLRAMLRTFLFD